MTPVAEIETALRRLKITPEAEALGLVKVWANALAAMDRAADSSGKLLLDGKPQPNFRSASVQTVQARLRKLIERAERAASQIEKGGKSEVACTLLLEEIKNLPADAVDALGRVGAISHEDRKALVSVGYLRTGFLADLKAGKGSADAILLVLSLRKTL